MENYVKAYAFDFIHDTQKVFREMLSALANPGTIGSITDEVKKFDRKEGALAILGCVVLDNEKSMYVEKNPRLEEIIHDLTLCREESLENADYIFLSSEMNYASIEEIFKNVKWGTYADPQESATIFIFCNSMEGTEPVVLSGPGVDGVKMIKTNSYIKNILEIRQKLKIEYPLGIDLFLLTEDGKIMGIPRLCKMDEKEA